MIGEHIGPYKIAAAIGQGGMATVYKAYQPAFDRYVAIKVLSRQFSEDPTFVKRFQREARVIARIEHKSIVPMYDYGEENGLYYIVMRLIEGGTLRKKMYYERIDLSTTAHIIQQVAEALDYAHQHDVIHRDLKPSNILIDERGNAYLTDFGIAKMLGSNTQVTQSGVVGTPSYMSPEQCQGKALGPASDIYSLSAIVFEVLTGSVPYEADTPLSVMYMHVRDPIPSARALNSKLPATIDRLFVRALAKQPQGRFPSAAAMVAEFRQIAGVPEEPVIKPQAKKSLFSPLFRRQGMPPSAPTLARPGPDEPSVPQAVVEDLAAPPEITPAHAEGDAHAYDDLDAVPARPQPAKAGQTLLAGAIGVVALLGLVGAGIFGLSSLGRRGGSVLVPSLPPPATPTDAEVSTQTPVFMIVTSAGPTVTQFSGGIIEPSATPSPLPTSLPPSPTTSPPTNTPPPTATLAPVTATAIPPSDTAIPPTNPPPPPTNTAIPVLLTGKIIYTEGTNNGAEIVVIDANGQNRQQLTNDNQYEGEPDWSPDGSRIAYEGTTGGSIDIFTMAANGADIRQITNSNEPNNNPDWSPNGTLIAYESGPDGSKEIYVIHADGSSPTRLTNNTFNDRAPKFSPDGTKIATMTQQRGKWEIAIMAYPSGNQVALFDCPAPACRFPSWSPDGTRIAYNSLDSQGTPSGIWIVDVATGQSTALLQGAEDGRPAWSGDGKIIFLTRTVNTQSNIYRVSVATREIVQLTSVLDQAVGPDWGP
jgi:tRNA A-37 threonylcarbamoyl transferase component Bud32